MDNWQDWNVIKLKKPPTKRTTTGEVVSRDRHAESKIPKLDQVNDAEHVPTVSLQLKTQIMQARLAKKMSQKDLANACNEAVNLIQAYENGKAVPDHRVLQKMRRILGVKLSKT